MYDWRGTITVVMVANSHPLPGGHLLLQVSVWDSLPRPYHAGENAFGDTSPSLSCSDLVTTQLKAFSKSPYCRTQTQDKMVSKIFTFTPNITEYSLLFGSVAPIFWQKVRMPPLVRSILNAPLERCLVWDAFLPLPLLQWSCLFWASSTGSDAALGSLQGLESEGYNFKPLLNRSFMNDCMQVTLTPLASVPILVTCGHSLLWR